MRISWSKDMLRRGESAHSARLYDRVMAGALEPAFYLAGVVEDTFEGRFQMVSVHTMIARRQLRRFGNAGIKRAELLFARALSGFDYALREQGTGDHSIARKARKLGEEFYGLSFALKQALQEEDPVPAVESVLVRNGIGGERVSAFARYILASDEHLAALPEDHLSTGQFQWLTFDKYGSHAMESRG